MSYYIVLLETSGNQDFIFATNRLRENVGASELTHRAGTKMVLDAVKMAGGPDLWVEDSGRRRESIGDLTKNRSIFEPETKVEVIIATSGKAILLVDKKETGKNIIQAATLAALREAPGLDLRGVVTHEFKKDGSVHEAIKQAHELFERMRSRMTGPEARCLRLPIVENCRTSGLPAANAYRPYWAKNDEEVREPRSSMSSAKQDAAQNAVTRIGSLFSAKDGRSRLLRSPDELDRFDSGQGSPEWLAVIHADGNLLGQMFLDFERLSGTEGYPEEYIDKIRRFSLAIEECTVLAFSQALDGLASRINRTAETEEAIPVVPIVLGGDDLTVVCDGHHALNLCRDFLTFFEDETAKKNGPRKGIIPEIASAMYQAEGGLSACAGVAIVKPHYPFHAAYQIAEDLITVAKKVKERKAKSGHAMPLSAMDVHVHYDASGSDLADIRRKLNREAGVHLMARPFVVSPVERLNELTEADGSWARHRLWGRLVHHAMILHQTDETGRRKLPNGMLHDLREALFTGREGAESRLELYRSRYQDAGIEKLLAGEEPNGQARSGLFWEEGGEHHTSLLDAMDLAEFVAAEVEVTDVR